LDEAQRSRRISNLVGFFGYIFAAIRSFTNFRTSVAGNGFSAGNRSVPLLVS
jgi:hypothetical protein